MKSCSTFSGRGIGQALRFPAWRSHALPAASMIGLIGESGIGSGLPTPIVAKAEIRKLRIRFLGLVDRLGNGRKGG